MLLSELQYTIKGIKKIAKCQKCLVKCDECGKEFERIYKTIEDSRKKFNKDVCASCGSKILIKLGKKKTFTEYNKAQKGKSLEERLGKEKGKNAKLKMSLKNSGENNPNFGGKYSRFEGAIEWNRKNIKGKTYEEGYGYEKANKIKKKFSSNNTGKGNPMYGKPSPKGSGNGWSGHYLGYYFRSLLELAYLKYLLDNNIKFENGERKEYSVDYKLGEADRIYHPDYYLINSQEIIEIKPKKLINTYENKLKFEAAKNKYKDNFKILTEEEISKLTLEELYNLRSIGNIIFDKRYDVKFEEYYNKNTKEGN